MRNIAMSLAVVILLGACQPASSEPEVLDENATDTLVEHVNIADPRMVLSPVPGNPAAVYFDLTYASDAAVTLESASVEGAMNTMIHRSQATENGMTMSEVEGLELIPGETAEFKPGGLHIMAMGVSAEIKAGQMAQVTLLLSNGSTITFEAEVRGAGDER